MLAWNTEEKYSMEKKQFKRQTQKHGGILGQYILKQYGKREWLRYIGRMPVSLIGYIQTKNNMNWKKLVCKCTVEGRTGIHKSLKSEYKTILELMKSNHIFIRTDKSFGYLN